MIISTVVAMNSKYLIGINNDLPWRLKDDLEHFKNYTLNKPIIMGRKTFESIGRVLPNRFNVIVSSTLSNIKKAEIVKNLDSAISVSKEYCEKNNQQEIAIIGGAGVIKEAKSIINKLVVSWVDADHLEGEVYYPQIDLKEWRELTSKEFKKSEVNEYNFTIKEYLRV